VQCSLALPSSGDTRARTHAHPHAGAMAQRVPVLTCIGARVLTPLALPHPSRCGCAVCVAPVGLGSTHRLAPQELETAVADMNARRSSPHPVQVTIPMEALFKVKKTSKTKEVRHVCRAAGSASASGGGGGGVCVCVGEGGLPHTQHTNAPNAPNAPNAALEPPALHRVADDALLCGCFVCCACPAPPARSCVAA